MEYQDVMTAAHIELLLDSLHIQNGDVILLQADLNGLDTLFGQETTLIETILKRIGPKGLLMVPAFTLQSLDPSSDSKWPYTAWKMMRENHTGYSSKTMQPDIWQKTANTVLLHFKTKRSEHPMFSIAWLGPSNCKPELTTLDYPLSYNHVLRNMLRPNACNLLIGVPLDQAIYPVLDAHALKEDITTLASARTRKVSKVFEKPFLYSLLKEEWQDPNIEVQERELGPLPVYKITQTVDYSKLLSAVPDTL